MVGCRSCDWEVAGSTPVHSTFTKTRHRSSSTRASVTKRYNLLPAMVQGCSSAGKVMAGLAKSNSSLLLHLWLSHLHFDCQETGVSSDTGVHINCRTSFALTQWHYCSVWGLDVYAAFSIIIIITVRLHVMQRTVLLSQFCLPVCQTCVLWQN